MSSNNFCNIVVNNLPKTLTKQELARLFSRFGIVLNTLMFFDYNNKEPTGTGFVEFKDPEAALRAIELANGKCVYRTSQSLFFCNASSNNLERLIVKFDSKNDERSLRPISKKLRIGKVSRSLLTNDIIEILEKFGIIDDLVVLQDKDDKEYNKIFVTYRTIEEATKAYLALNNVILPNQKVPWCIWCSDPIKKENLAHERPKIIIGQKFKKENSKI